MARKVTFAMTQLQYAAYFSDNIADSMAEGIPEGARKVSREAPGEGIPKSARRVSPERRQEDIWKAPAGGIRNLIFRLRIRERRDRTF
jgi:hypothetical protein